MFLFVTAAIRINILYPRSNGSRQIQVRISVVRPPVSLFFPTHSPASVFQGLLVFWWAFISPSFPEEETVREVAACMQEHVREAWLPRCECAEKVCRAGGLWKASSENLPRRLGVPGQPRSHACLLLSVQHKAWQGLAHVSKALSLFRAVCYCLCHHKFKKGKLIKYGTRLSNIF